MAGQRVAREEHESTKVQIVWVGALNEYLAKTIKVTSNAAKLIPQSSSAMHKRRHRIPYFYCLGTAKRARSF